MNTIENFSLKEYNTFGIEAKAKQFVSVSNSEELIEVLKTNSSTPIFILGGGSNMLLTKDIDALVIHINLKGKKIIREDADYAWVEGMAGENWHEFVLWTIEQGLGGLENLSLIPGNVGTTPIQNIGAYGVEIKDTFDHCTAISRKTGEEVTFDRDACKFDYRESIFKNEAKDQFVIAKVVYKLTKRNHKKNTSYGAIEQELASNNIIHPTLKDISNAVIAIRNSKLPNPKELGNSGSFFKNPIVPIAEFKKIQSQFPDMPFYKISDTEVKVPAGWLIETAGFKGKKFGDAGIHSKQALVLVNYGNATGNEIWELSKHIQQTIWDKFGLKIEAEVNII